MPDPDPVGLSLHRVVDGRIVEEWEYNDDLVMFRALGFTLQPPSADQAGKADG